MSLTYRQRVSLLEDLQAEAAKLKALADDLRLFLEQHMARIENARWGDDPNEQRRDRWAKVPDKNRYRKAGQ